MRLHFSAFLKILLTYQILGPITDGLATTFSNRPLGAVVQEATFIVRGHARSSHSDWGHGSNQRTIFTYTDFEVTENLKGKTHSDRIVLRQPGGSKDDIEMAVPGTAAFSPGEEVVVTLAQADPSDGAYDVLNFTAGKYNVVNENGETYLVNSLSSGEIYDPGSHNPKDLSYTSKVSLQTFKKIIEGSAPEAAEQKQFSPSPSSSKLTSKTKTSHIDQSPMPEPTNSAIASPQAHQEKLDSKDSNPWVIISFLLIFFGVGLGLWWLLGTGAKGGGSE